MEFPTSAVYPLSHEDTSLLLSEMQHHSSEMDASRDEIEEGYEINITGDSTLEIAPTHTWSRKVVHAESSVQKRMSDKSRMTNSRTDAPLSPHIDITAEFGPVIDPVINENKDHDGKEYLTADEGSNSIMDTLSDLADGVDNEFDTVKGLLYKVKRERDTYKRSNHALQQSLSEAIAFKSDLETDHRDAIDAILCTANNEKFRLENELKESQESHHKLKKLLGEMTEEKAELESQMKKNEERIKEAERREHSDAEAKLEQERARHFKALSEAITDLEAKFESDLNDVIKEKDEKLENREKEHKMALTKLESILKDAVEEKEAEIKKEKHSHSMIVEALEKEQALVKEELKMTNENLANLTEEHAISDDVHDMEIADLHKEFEGQKSKMQKQFQLKESQLRKELASHNKAIDELESKLHTESLHSQVLVSELADKKTILVSKDEQIIALKKKLSERNDTYAWEYDRMKANFTKMCNLVESFSADRDCAREETRKLKLEHDKQSRVHKAEIERLKRKLEDGAREIMAQLASSDSSDSQERSEISGCESYDHSDMNLVARVKRQPCASEEESISYLGDIVSEEQTPTDSVSLENEPDSKVAGPALESNIVENCKEDNALNDKLMESRPELAFQEGGDDDLTAEFTKLKATILEKHQSLDTKSLFTLNQEVRETFPLSHGTENETFKAPLNEKVADLAQLEELLAKQEEELIDYKNKAIMYESLERAHDNLKAELTTLKVTASTPDDASAAAQLSKDISNLKLEHRVEVKILKKEHATTKTKVKLLKKELSKIGAEQRKMITVYNAEQQSNAELSSSLKELVKLLETERILHNNQIDSLRAKFDSLKIKFSRMKKKRVPIDAAFKATRVLLDSYEASGNTYSKISSGHLRSILEPDLELKDIKTVTSEKEIEIDVSMKTFHAAENKAAEQISSLTQQLEDAKVELDEMKTHMMSIVSQDEKAIGKLQQKIKDEIQLKDAALAQVQVLEEDLCNVNLQLSEKVDEIECLTQQLNETKVGLDELESQIEYHVQKDGETISGLEQQVSHEQQLHEGTVKKMNLLKEEIAELEVKYCQLKQINENTTCSQREYEEQVKRHSEEVELLRKQMTDAEIKSKEVMKDEVDKLKSEFNEVITAFEKELVDTCESNATEVSKLHQKLAESKENTSSLEMQIAELKSDNEDLTNQIDKKMSLEVELTKTREQLVQIDALQTDLSTLQTKHEELMESFDKIKATNIDLNRTLEETEASKSELKSKLQDMCVDHESLQRECDVLRGDSSNLRSLISSLTSEKEQLINDLDKQVEQYKSVCDIRSSLEQEIEKHNDHHSSLETLVPNLRDELKEKSEQIESLKKDILSKQQQSEALQEQSKVANKHLDEMVTYCDKLKGDFAATSASLRKEIDEQAHSMKEVLNALKNQLEATETEKEENRKMYESDIELQQKEIETLKQKNAEALTDLDSLSNLVSSLKDAVEEEKSNNQRLCSQLKESDSEGKVMKAQNYELKEELASKTASEAILQERIRNIEMEVSDLRPMPDKLTESIKAENEMRERIHILESQLNDLGDVEKKLMDAKSTETTLRDRIHGLENQSKNFQIEYKNSIKRKEEESSKLRVVLQECRDKLQRFMAENERLKHDNTESVGNLKSMLNEAISSRADTEAALQESLQLLEQQKRVDIKRKGELCKLEQTVDILQSKERYLESYVSSLKNQINRGFRDH